MAAPSTAPAHSESAEEELGRVRLALQTVFSSRTQSANPSPQWFSQRALADQYLTSFQSTSVAWMVCDRLLQDETTARPEEIAHQQQVRFFAAQTLQTKCRADMFQLPVESRSSLRDSLVAHLQRLINESKALTVRLAMCISALAVQIEWLTILTDLLAAPPEPQQVQFTMLILQTLPEECASDRLLLQDESSRFKMRDHLISSSPAVLQFLHAHMQHAEMVLEVLHLWVRYVPVQPQALLESPLLAASIEALRSPEYLEAASDVVVQVLRMYPSHHYGNEQLVAQIIPQLSALPLQEALQSDDEDVLQAYCRVITEMGESYMSIILSTNQPAFAGQLVNAVLQCSRTPHHEISSMTLHFWYRFVYDLDLVDPYQWRQELIDTYTPQLLELLDICVTSLMRYPSEMDDDMYEDLKRHRYHVSETIDDCCRLVGGDIILARLNQLWDAHSQQSWHTLESCMACLCAIHRYVPSDVGSPILPKCFQVIPQLPENIVPLRQTSCRACGKFASWLAKNTQFTTPLLPYLAKGLENPQCAPDAASAIRELCECSNSLFSLANPVLALYQGLPPGSLDIDSELEILQGGCRALSRQIQDSQASAAESHSILNQLAQPIGTRLAAAVSETNSSVHRVIPEIQRFTIIIQHLVIPFQDASHPMLELLNSSWSLLEAAVNRFPTDPTLAETICQLHKHSLRSCGSAAYAPNLDRLLTHLVQSFEKSRQSPYLYAASICIAEYALDSSYIPRLLEMLSAMSQVCFSFLRDLNEMTAQPDVVEELFYLVERMVSKCPDPLIQNPLLEPLVQFSAEGMKLDHFGANKGVLKFVDSTVSLGQSLQTAQPLQGNGSLVALERVLGSRGQALVTNLVLAVMGDLPAYNSQQLFGILWKFYALCPTLFPQWLHGALQQSGSSCSSSDGPSRAAPIPDQVKNDFMNTIINNNNNNNNGNGSLSRQDFVLVVRTFQDACNRHRRQAAQRPRTSS